MLVILLVIIFAVYLLIPRYTPPIVFNDFVSSEERRYIMEKAKDKLQPSTVSMNRVVKSNVRQSETAWLSLDDPVIRKIVNRCLAMTDRSIDNCENLQVVRYEEGGFYRPHQDAMADQDNKRMYTFIIALNDEYDGGATLFPNLGTAYKLTAGDVLFFHTLDNYGFMTSKALHGGMSVGNGEKWICNLWVNKYPLTAET